MERYTIAPWDELEDRTLAGFLVENVDLVAIRFGDELSVFYGRCLHRGALLADAHVDGRNLVCGVHNWDYRLQTGISEYANDEQLPKFNSWVEDGDVFVDLDKIREWKRANPQPYDRDAYQGAYQDHSGTPDEPHTGLIRDLASHGLEKVGEHGPVAAMGVPRSLLPAWDDIQFVTGQLANVPQLDEVDVGTDLVVGPNADKPLTLDIPLMVSDMSYGALSEEAKVAVGERRGAGWDRHLCGRRRDAAGGTGSKFTIFLRTSVGEIRLLVGQAPSRSGVPFQGRTRSQNGHRRASSGGESNREVRRRSGTRGRSTCSVTGPISGVGSHGRVS